MFSWFPSKLKRFKTPRKKNLQSKKREELVSSSIRIGKNIHPCDVVDGLSEKNLINIKYRPIEKLPTKIELKLSDEQTFRWMQVRWHHGNQISAQPITTWAIK